MLMPFAAKISLCCYPRVRGLRNTVPVADHLAPPEHAVIMQVECFWHRYTAWNAVTTLADGHNRYLNKVMYGSPAMKVRQGTSGPVHNCSLAESISQQTKQLSQ